MVRPTFSKVLKDYFFNRKQIPIWALLFLVFAASAVNVTLSVELNAWNGRFYNALQKVDVPKIYDCLGEFIVIVGATVAVVVLSGYIRKRVELMMRRDLTFVMFEQWLSKDSTMYRMRESTHEPDNPDQRIAEDIRDIVNISVGLGLSFFSSVLTVGSFSVILWNLSGSITLFGYNIPGYMFWVCLIYTVLETLITHLLGRRLKYLNYEGQHREAEVRRTLIEKRQHADAIAGSHGEQADKHGLKTKFNHLMEILIQEIKTERNMGFFTVTVNQVTNLTPIFFALPSLFAGTIQLGGLMQIRQAFVRVDRSLSWFARSYSRLAQLLATYDRLNRLQKRMHDVDTKHAELSERISTDTRGLDADVNIAIPHQNDNKPFNVAMRVDPGQVALLCGASGTGKSTLMRTFAGFNSKYGGRLARAASFMWMPQKGYIFKGSFKANLCYPSLETDFDDEAVRRVLTVVGLEYFADKLDQVQEWGHRLSGGEQQRVMLCRALLHRPALLMIDEMTSALDIDAAVKMVQTLRTHLPEAAILLISHQEDLRGVADRVYHMSELMAQPA